MVHEIVDLCKNMKRKVTVVPCAHLFPVALHAQLLLDASEAATIERGNSTFLESTSRSLASLSAAASGHSAAVATQKEGMHSHHQYGAGAVCWWCADASRWQRSFFRALEDEKQKRLTAESLLDPR